MVDALWIAWVFHVSIPITVHLRMPQSLAKVKNIIAVSSCISIQKGPGVGPFPLDFRQVHQKTVSPSTFFPSNSVGVLHRLALWHKKHIFVANLT